MILKFYNIEKNSFYQRHKFWMQINIFDIFDVFMIFYSFKFPMILKFYNIEKNSFYQRHKFWMQINIFDIFASKICAFDRINFFQYYKTLKSLEI